MDGAANFMDDQDMEFGETRKPRFSGFEREKTRDGLFQRTQDGNHTTKEAKNAWI